MIRKKVVFLTIAVVLAVFLVWVVYQARKEIANNSSQRRSVFYTDPGKSYSVVIDGERFSIPVSEHEKIIVSVEPLGDDEKPKPIDPHIRIPDAPLDAKMSAVQQSRFYFRYDSPEDLREFRLAENLDKLHADDDWTTARNVMHWARNQFEHSPLETYPPQNALAMLREIRAGRATGFCAQYCYLTVQALQALGCPARYVSIQGHEVCEVWLSSRQKWILLDPDHDAFFTDPKGQLLCALDISRCPEAVQVVTDHSISDRMDLLRRFRHLAYWLRNDLYTKAINFYDLPKYKVYIAETGFSEFISENPCALITTYPEELYEPPNGL